MKANFGIYNVKTKRVQENPELPARRNFLGRPVPVLGPNIRRIRSVQEIAEILDVSKHVAQRIRHNQPEKCLLPDADAAAMVKEEALAVPA